MHRAPARLLTDGSGVSSTIGTIGLTALAVVFTVGAAFAASAIVDLTEEGIPESSSFSAASKSDGKTHSIRLTAGSLDVDATTLRITIDGVKHTLPLSWYRDQGIIGDSLGIGEWVCIAGPDPECPFPKATDVRLSIQTTYGPALELGQLGTTDAATNSNPIKLQMKRASFLIDDSGGIVIQEDARMHLHVVGTEITWGATGPDIPVTVLPTTDGGATYFEVFGGAVTAGQVHDFGILPAGSVVGAEATAAIYWYSMTQSSVVDSPLVATLRHGDSVPTTPAWAGQVPVGSLLGPYAAEGFIVLEPNEIIVLYELGTTNLNSPAADFQDLVLIFTVDPDLTP